MLPALAGLAVGGLIASSFLGDDEEQSQYPLETREQKVARENLLEYGLTGKYNGMTMGEDIGIKPGDYGMTGYEKTGLTSLEKLLSNIPEQYKMGDDALKAYLATDPMDVSAQYDPFKAKVERQISESERQLKRGAGVMGNLYSTDTIRGLGDIQARGNETLTSELARLTDSSLNRRLQAIPLAYQSAESQQASELQKVGASQSYGALTRNLNNAAIEARNNEILRRRTEAQLPLQALGTVVNTNTTFGVPSVSSSPYQDLLKMMGSVGGQYLGGMAGAAGARAGGGS